MRSMHNETRYKDYEPAEYNIPRVRVRIDFGHIPEKMSWNWYVVEPICVGIVNTYSEKGDNIEI